MKPGGAQRKGKIFERHVARVFGVRRGLQTIGRERVPDVDLPGWWPECKRQRKPNVVRAWEQAESAAFIGDGRRVPVAITKADNGPELVTLALGDFASLLACAERARFGQHGECHLCALHRRACCGVVP